jgi:glycosyltransferase involved in cell wall biosynthesis
MALVTIGIPNYQRPQPLSRCLATLADQTFRDIRILVSDDSSPDPRVREVMLAAAAADPRVTCLFQSPNIGMFANFWLLLQAAETPYFMWSSNDDYWDARFVAEMVALLDANPQAAVACGGLRHFNAERISPTVYSPLRFTSTGDKMRDLALFLAEPEILGKSHLLYGLYRTDALREAVRTFGFGAHDRWNEDVLIAFSVLCRHGVAAVDAPFLFKHRPGRLEFAPARFSSDHGVPWRRYPEYVDGLLAACATPEQRKLVRQIMGRRRLYHLAVTSWRKPLERRLSGRKKVDR